MARSCSVCSHPAREEIDASLVRRVSYRDISGRFSVSESALGRHLNEHLADYVRKVLREYDQEKGIRVLNKLGSMVDRFQAFLDRAEEEEDGAEFRATAAELRKQLELVSKLQGELQQEGTVNIYTNPEFIQVQTLILQILEPYPEARQALAAGLREARTPPNGLEEVS